MQINMYVIRLLNRQQNIRALYQIKNETSNVTTSGIFKNTQLCNRNCLPVPITSMQNAIVIYHFKAEVMSIKEL